MTVIAGLIDPRGGAWLAADSASSGSDGRLWTVSKIVRRPVGDSAALLGSAGDHRLTGILRTICFPEGGPNPSSDEDCDAWAQAVADAITEQALDARPPVTDDQGLLDGYALLGHAGRLWVLFTSCAERVEQYAAIGSGGDYALGALDALHVATSIDPQRALRIACQSACRHHEGCRPPIHVDHVALPSVTATA